MFARGRRGARHTAGGRSAGEKHRSPVYVDAAAVVELFHPRAHAHLRALRALEYID